MEGSFKRGWGADFYNEPGWPAALAGLEGHYRLDVLRAGLLLFGVAVPMALERFGQDPAVASSVFLTTITDVVGFLAFLATLLLL